MPYEGSIEPLKPQGAAEAYAQGLLRSLDTTGYRRSFCSVLRSQSFMAAQRAARLGHHRWQGAGVATSMRICRCRERVRVPSPLLEFLAQPRSKPVALLRRALRAAAIAGGWMLPEKHILRVQHI